MAKRWVLYDFDMDELATTAVYDSPKSAAEDANEFDNVMVVCLGDIAAERDNDLV